MKKFFTVFILFFSVMAAHAQLNITLRSHLPYAFSLANIGGYVDSLGKEYALVGHYNGLDIVDVTNPDVPVIRFTIPGPASEWREVKTYRKYAYITTENGSVGLQVVDLSHLPDTVYYKGWTGDSAITGQLTTIHSLHIDTARAFLYLYGSNIITGASNNGYPLFISLADPWNPHYAGRFIIGSGNPYVHDGYVQNDTAYFCHIYTPGFVSVVNLADKSAPVLLNTFITPSQFPHNSWLSDDHKTVFTTDEVAGAFLTAYDVTDLGNISELSRFRCNPVDGNADVNSIPHNVHILNDYAVTSWYTEGVVITDESRPGNPIEVGHYDTYPSGNPAAYAGDWGVYPFLPSGNLVLSDINSGLYVLTPTYKRGCYLEGVVTDSITGAQLHGASVQILTTPAATTTNLSGFYATGYAIAGTYSVQVTKTGYRPKTINGVTLTNGVLTPLYVQLAPLQLFSYSGTVVDSASGNPIPNASVEILNPYSDTYTTCDGSGHFTANIYTDNNTIIAGIWGHKTRCVSLYTDISTAPVTMALPRGYSDDFSFDFGWTVSSSSPNVWQRGEPVGTYNGTQVVNPEYDATTDCGDKCYVTDNGGGGPYDHDVDNGNTVLISPWFDATLINTPYIDYSRWFIDILGTGLQNDTMVIKLDNGSNKVVLETMFRNLGGNGQWVHRHYKIASYIPVTSTMRLIAEITDYTPDNVVEGGLDNFEIVGAFTDNINALSANPGQLLVSGNPFHTSTLINYSFSQISAASGNALLRVNDVLGNIVEEHALTSPEGQTSVGQNLSAGMYFVTLYTNEGKSRTVKIVKE